MDRTKLNQELNENQMIFYGTKEIARSLCCSIPLAREIMHRPDFPLVKVGKNLKVYKDAFEKWASERRL
jgi:hypothetical protein